MLSSRYAPAIVVALLLALVPTVIHSYVGLVVDDGRTTASIPTSLSAYTSVPTKRSPEWGKSHFESTDWLEREYRRDGDEVVLTVIRSYDLKELYHHPELAVAYHSTKFDGSSVQMPVDRPDMPVHVLTNSVNGAVALYVLHYDGGFVSDPIAFQLRTAGEQLFTGRKPMTLFFVRDDIPDRGDPLQLPAAKLLFEAVDRFVGSRSAQ